MLKHAPIQFTAVIRVERSKLKGNMAGNGQEGRVIERSNNTHSLLSNPLPASPATGTGAACTMHPTSKVSKTSVRAENMLEDEKG